MTRYLSNVANSGQVNTPPGSYETVKEWIRAGLIGPHSSVLEVGCSTGFITIEVARYTGAHCTGVDLHEGSVARARANIDSGVANLVTFDVANAAKLPFEANTFSHVVVSGHLPFVPHEMRVPHIEEAMRVLRPWGSLLTGLYYYRDRPSAKLTSEFNARIGTYLTPDDDKSYWTRLFDHLPATLEYESDHRIIPADQARTEEYLARLAPDTQDDWRENVGFFNRNGEHLNYFVRVYRKLPDDPSVMLQLPRGGIYRSEQLSSFTF